MSQENTIFEKRVNKIIDERFGIKRPEQLAYLVSQTGITLEDFEKKFIQSVLEQEKFNKSKTAERLGITWQTLDRRIIKHKITLK